MRFHKRFPLIAACSAAAIITVLGATAGASQAARQAGTPKLTWAKVFAMPPTRVAALQNPLLAAAAPLQEVGSTTLRDIYWGTALDTPAHAVDLYVTDPSRAAGLIAAAKRRDPQLDSGLIRVERTAYSAASLTAAGSRLIAASIGKRLPFGLNGIGQLDRGASLRSPSRTPATVTFSSPPTTALPLATRCTPKTGAPLSGFPTGTTRTGTRSSSIPGNTTVPGPTPTKANQMHRTAASSITR